MKQGTLLLQRANRPLAVKTITILVLVAGLCLAMQAPRVDIAILAVIVIWTVLYKVAHTILLKRDWYNETVPWTLTEDELTIGERTIPVRDITRAAVHQRPGMTAGKKGRGWELVIETERKSMYWYSQVETDRDQESMEGLRELAILLDPRAENILF